MTPNCICGQAIRFCRSSMSTSAGQGIEIGGFGEDGLWRNLKRLPRIDPALDVAQTSFATQLV